MAEEKKEKVNIAEILGKSVRTVGVFKPKFNPKDGTDFDD